MVTASSTAVLSLRSAFSTLRLGALALLLACGGGGGAPNSPPTGSSNPPPTGTIAVGQVGTYGEETNIFTPVTLTVARGTTVTWVWKGNGHTVESGEACTPDGRFSSHGIQAPGYTLTYTFNTAGTFPYYCTSHCPEAMKGVVIVQ